MLRFVLLLVALTPAVKSCGMMTHMEVGFRALENLNLTYRGIDIRAMIQRHTDAFHTGAVYPDSYYSNTCYKGRFHDVSETTHWMDFIAPALDYYNQVYPKSKPIDEAGEKLLTFLLGVVVHDVSDIVWHSLGIDQGFIDSMAQVNFWGDYQQSHSVADPGGDVVNLYEMFYATTFSENSRNLGHFEWYVPVQDVLNIYKNIGIDFNATLVQHCAVELMQAGADAERDTFDKLYPDMVSKAPFLGAQLRDFFLGGMNDMTWWVFQRWQTAFLYLEAQGQNCTNTQHSNNPIYWVCANQAPIKPPPSDFLQPWQTDPKIYHQLKRRAVNRLFERAEKARLADGIKTEVEADSKLGSLILRRKANHDHKTSRTLVIGNSFGQCDSNTYYLEKSYSSIGQVLLSTDINKDGFDDLIVGAPGFSFDNRPQEGRVFVVFGTAQGLPQRQFDLQTADLTFWAPFTGRGLFGFAIASADFNNDSLPDLAISAPLFAPNPVDALYSGQVYVYYAQGIAGRFKVTVPSLTIDCGQRYCNFGSTLTVGDVNRDGLADLIIGSPFSSKQFTNLRQSGFVSSFFSRSNPNYPTMVNVMEAADDLVFGQAPYSWFGYSVAATGTGPCNLLIGAPAINHQLANGTLLQMAGSVYCYVVKESLTAFANGTKNFENFGTSLAVGYPLGKSSGLQVAIGAAHDENEAKVLDVLPVTLNQSGTVYFYNANQQTGALPYGMIRGDRHYGRLGHFVIFINANNDGYDDLFVGAPIRQPHLTDLTKGEAVGEAYLFYGNATFPANINKRPCKADLNICPGDQADKYLSLGENKAQFGYSGALLRFNANFTQLVIAAPRSDGYARQSGKLLLYTGC